MTALETMGAFVAQVRGQVPAATRVLAARHLTDTAGAWVAGAHTAEGRRLTAQPGEGLLRDIGLHCALTRLSEIDNIHLASSTTPGGIVIPAALTIAASRPDCSPDALVEAIVAGTEAMIRLGLAIGGPTVLYRGIWPTYFAAPFGVAVVAARLYELDAAQAANALALALSFASPGVGHHNAESSSRWFAIGQAARNGLVAAQAAQAGFTSDLSLLDGEFLKGIYGITPDVAAFSRDLGQGFAFDDLSFKPWCAARQTMAATQGLLEIVRSGVAAASITAVEVYVPPTYLKMIDHGVKSGDRVSHLTSVQYHVALAACDQSGLYPGLYDVQHSPQRLAGDIDAFMKKITVAADEALLAHYPKAWPARVVVRAAGTTHEQVVVGGWGDPQRPFDDMRVEQKLRRVLTGVAAATVEGLLAASRSIVDGAGAPAELVRAIVLASRMGAA